jgi:ABC-type Mn2+/Zn2+ transport system ATPase subunit
MTSCGLHCLKIQHITVAIGDNVILRDINLHAHCGELTAIIGRNGAGKSTLLKAILGQIPHTGKVSFSGHNGSAMDNQKIGYVPQSLSVDSGSPSTVYDMLVSLISNYPIFLPRRPKMVRKLRNHLSSFNAAHLLDKKLGQLSGGELQRVLLAAATLPKPDLLLLDEPVSGVDQAGLQLFYKTLNNLKKSSDMVILIISHDLDFVRNYADHVILLNRGVETVGPPKEVFKSDEFRRAFATYHLSNKPD